MKKIYESPEVEVLEISLSDLLSESPADEEEYNGKNRTSLGYSLSALRSMNCNQAVA